MPFLLAASIPKELNQAQFTWWNVSEERWEAMIPQENFTPDNFFSAHEIAQPCRYTTSEAFQAVKGVCDIYTVLNLECYKRVRKWFHCANCLVVLGTLEGRLVGRHLNRDCTCSSILGLFLEERNSSQNFFRFPPRMMSGTAFS